MRVHTSRMDTGVCASRSAPPGEGPAYVTRTGDGREDNVGQNALGWARRQRSARTYLAHVERG